VRCGPSDVYRLRYVGVLTIFVPCRSTMHVEIADPKEGIAIMYELFGNKQ